MEGGPRSFPDADLGVTAAELGTDSSDTLASAPSVVGSVLAVSSVSLESGRGVLPVTPDDEGVGRLGPGSASSSLGVGRLGPGSGP